jgi:hypothetical protein
VWRSSAERLGDQSLELSPQRVSLRQELAVAGLPRKPGVYLLLPDVEDAWPAYVGETWDLRGRAQRTLQATAALDQLLPNSGHWQLEFFELDGVDQAERRGLQSVWIARTKPRLNYLELACPDAVVKASSASRIASPPETGA